MKKYLAIMALSIIAIANAAFLTNKAYYLKNTLPADRSLESSFCDINSTFSCTTVLDNPYTQVFGIPFPAIALVVYPIIFLLAFIGYRKQFFCPFKPLLALALGGMAFNGYILFNEYMYIGAYCYLCLICTGIIITIAILSSMGVCEGRKEKISPKKENNP